ncbi:hypothetical protein P88_00660 [Erwinia phage phiEt88]|uniref:hypothetical protein n=1 Tax=Erwinia phage phiEt88 TaxID=925984 RepID=UPI0001F1FC92|nr:hypothetical protein ErPhphiEt88_gp66 [Erwinia phage phiEt88]CBX44577.1 hypothetical protein P88_00660 [Erwinia phage phiEt88]
MKRNKLKIAYISAVKESKIPKATLIALHDVNENILDKWLYVKDRYPDFQACWELHLFIKQNDLSESKILNSIIQESIDRVQFASPEPIKISIISESNEILLREMEKRKPQPFKPSSQEPNGRERFYIFEGKHATTSELAKYFNKDPQSIRYYARKNKLRSGDKIDGIRNYFEVEVNPYTYSIKGKQYTKREIALVFNRHYQTIHSYITKHNIKPGESVDNILKPRKEHFYIYNGVSLTINEISAMKQMRYETVHYRIKTNKKKPGDNVTDIIDKPLGRGITSKNR